ncbi:MAG: hypothetical protein ACTSRD_13925 [Promethearchaeota archaeon]
MILVFAWLLIIFGVLAAIALVIYTEFGRDVSIPFSVIMILVAALCIGFSIHMFLISNSL